MILLLGGICLNKNEQSCTFGPETRRHINSLHAGIFISAAWACYFSACPALSQFYKWEFPHLIYVGKCHTKLLFSIKDRRMRFVYA